MMVKISLNNGWYRMLKEISKWLVAAAVFALPAVILEVLIFFGD